MKKIIWGIFLLLGVCLVAEPAMAAQELSSSGVLNDVLVRFHNAASTWGPAIEGAASRLFWSLVVISMVWTFGMMLLRKADIGEFFAEFVRFTIFTGFFWWLLTNATQGMDIAGTIIESMQTLGAQAGHLPSSNLGPSSVVDLGFELYNKTVQATSELGWQQMGTAIVMELMALAILLVLALIAVNLLLLLASSWILLYAGVFFLGFGGSRWTSDMAINYYKTVLGIGAQLLAMILIVAIGKDFLTYYYGQIGPNMASQELAVMLVIAICLLTLVHRIPPLIAGIITGSSVGGTGIGSFGAGALVGAAAMATSGVGFAAQSASMVAGAAMGGAANAVGGASAIKAAFEQAQSAMSSDADISSPSDSNAETNAGVSGGGGDGAKTDDSPYARAAGFDSSSAKDSATASRTQRAASLAASTAGTLAKGVLSQAAGKFQERVNDTMGARLASVISEGKQSGDEATKFTGDNLSGADIPDIDDEVAAFRDRDSEPTP